MSVNLSHLLKYRPRTTGTAHDGRSYEIQSEVIPPVEGATKEQVVEMAIWAQAEQAGMPEEEESPLDGIDDVRELAAIYRSSASSQASKCTCDSGHLIRTWHATDGSLSADVIFDDRVRHISCSVYANGSALPNEAIPRIYRPYSTRNLKPYGKSVIPEKVQQEMIEQLPINQDNVISWLLVGPPGTSKTTYSSVVIKDWLTWRCIGENYDSFASLNFWRIKVPMWMRSQEAWEYRDFENMGVKEPGDSIERIQQVIHGDEWGNGGSRLRPIVVLEEIDKFNPTKNRIDRLFSLVDMLYEANAIFVTTSNMTLKELEEHVGSPIYRRLTGKNEEHSDGYLIWDLFGVAKKSPKKAA